MYLSAWLKSNPICRFLVAQAGVILWFVGMVWTYHQFELSLSPVQTGYLTIGLTAWFFLLFRVMDVVFGTPAMPKLLGVLAYLIFFIYGIVQLLLQSDILVGVPINLIKHFCWMGILAYLALEGVAQIGEWLWRVTHFSFQKILLKKLDQTALTSLYVRVFAGLGVGLILLLGLINGLKTYLSLEQAYFQQLIQTIALMEMSLAIILFAQPKKHWIVWGTIGLAITATFLGGGFTYLMGTMVGFTLHLALNRVLSLPIRSVGWCMLILLLLIPLSAWVDSAVFAKATHVLDPSGRILGCAVLGALMGFLGIVLSYCQHLNWLRYFILHSGIWAYALIQGSMGIHFFLAVLVILLFWAGLVKSMHWYLKSKESQAWYLPIQAAMFYKRPQQEAIPWERL